MKRILFFFFFSSRRRHTRSLCDWSSDVCSSDLDRANRERIVAEMRTPAESWENLGLLAGSPDRIILAAFGTNALKPLTGKSLGEVARMRGKSPEDTAIDLVIEDDGATGAIYFLMSEENIRKGIAQPW